MIMIYDGVSFIYFYAGLSKSGNVHVLNRIPPILVIISIVPFRKSNNIHR